MYFSSHNSLRNSCILDFYSSYNPPGGCAVAQSVERAIYGKEVPGSIAAVAARSLLVGSVSV